MRVDSTPKNGNTNWLVIHTPLHEISLAKESGTGHVSNSGSNNVNFFL